MTGEKHVDADHARRIEALSKRRLQLGLRWSEVARRAGMTPGNLARIRRGEIGLSEVAAAGLERALKFAEGTLAAGDPIPIEHPSPMAGEGAERIDAREMGRATPEKLAEMYLLVEDELGPAEAERFLRRVMELRQPGVGRWTTRATDQDGRATG